MQWHGLLISYAMEAIDGGGQLRRFILLVAIMALFPSTANAAWLRASSAHFVVYANDSESKVKGYAEDLERYHAAMALLTGGDSVAPSPSNRVSVFIVKGQGEVRRLYGENSQNISGFYIPRAGGSIAIVPRVSTAGRADGDLDFSMVALLHEYAHHFLISSNSFPMPRWMSEGAAEFFASASFDKDGGIGVGRPAAHRAGELLYAREVTATDLLDPEAYERRHKGNAYDSFYGKSWLLYHYLALGKERPGQMELYLKALMQGKSSRDAGAEAFGDFGKLERDLNKYMARSRMTMLRLNRSMLRIGTVQVARLSDGEAAIMPVIIRSRRGVTQETALNLLLEARAIAGRYPADAPVLSALAEAEFDAGNDTECIAAADKALAVDRAQVNAYVQKGYALFRQAHNGQGDAAAYVRARAPFVALNRIEQDHPLPLIYYYRSFVQAGIRPSRLAIDGLQRAVDLAPFDEGLRMTLATQELREGHRDRARVNLVPVAYSPHANQLTEAARKMLTRLDTEPNWNGRDVADDFIGKDEDAGR